MYTTLHMASNMKDLTVKPHKPPEQVATALAGATQVCPQAPHDEGLLVKLTSQPFAGLLSQLPNPATHCICQHTNKTLKQAHNSSQQYSRLVFDTMQHTQACTDDYTARARL
jgi:hypothetical protein